MHGEHFLSSWLLEDVEGQADVKSGRKKLEMRKVKVGKERWREKRRTR